jgi:hypothetical protein
MALSLGVVGTRAHAAWETIPEIGLRSEIDDNARLSPIDQESSSRAVLDARFRLSNFGQIGNAYVEPRIVTDAYSDARDEQLEADDLFFVALGQYNWQTVGLGFDLNYADESVLRSEYENALPDAQDIEAPSDGTAGTVGGYAAQRERSDVGFNLDIIGSERTTFRFATQRLDVAYIEDTTFGRVRTPYDNTEVTASIIRRVDERNSVSASAFVAEYNAEINSNTTNTYGVEGRFTRPLTQRWTMDLTAGVQRSDYTYVDVLNNLVDNADADFTLGIIIRKRSELTNWNASVGRYVTPSSNGFLEARNELRVVVTHEFSGKLSGSFGLRMSEYTPLNESESLPERQYANAALQLEWALRRRWFVTGGVDYSDEERTDFAALQADSTMIYVGMTYRGLSRQ